MKPEPYKYLHLAIIENEREWAELFWAVAAQNTTSYESLKRLTVQEFFSIFKPWREKMEAIRKQHEQRTKK